MEMQSLGVTKAWFVVESDWSLVSCSAFVLNTTSFLFFPRMWNGAESKLDGLRLKFDVCFARI